MEEPGRLQSMGSLGVGHDWGTSLSLFTFMHWRRKWQPTPVFLPGESQGWRSLVGCRLWGHTESDTTKRLSSSSSRNETDGSYSNSMFSKFRNCQNVFHNGCTNLHSQQWIRVPHPPQYLFLSHFDCSHSSRCEIVCPVFKFLLPKD